MDFMKFLLGLFWVAIISLLFLDEDLSNGVKEVIRSIFKK